MLEVNYGQLQFQSEQSMTEQAATWWYIRGLKKIFLKFFPFSAENALNYRGFI